MSYKEEMIMILAKAEHTVHDNVGYLFSKALSDAKVTGESLESIIYEIFEGLESAGEDEAVLIQSADIVTRILLEHTKEEMSSAYKAYCKARDAYHENVDKQYASMDEVLRTLTDYADDHDHKVLLENCTKKKSFYFEQMNKVNEKIRYNHKLDN